MKPTALLREYLNRRLSKNELRLRLSKTNSREARAKLQILSTEESCRNALKELGWVADVRERLVQKVVALESWAQVEGERKREPSRGWFSRLLPDPEVFGHSKSDKTDERDKKRPKLLTDKKGRSRKKSPVVRGKNG